MTEHSRILNAELCENFEKATKKKLIPGQKICVNCLKHINRTISDYEEQFKYCCDPFERHRNPTDVALQTVDSRIIENFALACGVQLMPDVKVCSICYNKIESKISEFNTQDVNFPIADDTGVTATNGSQINDHESPETEQNTPASDYQSNSQQVKNIDSMLAGFDILPMKRPKLDDKKTER